MKLRILLSIVSEGLSNIFKNKIMSMISLMMVLITLVIAGLSAIVVVNLRYNADRMRSIPEVVVYVDPIYNEQDARRIYDEILSYEEVQSIQTITKAQAYEEARELLGDNQRLLSGFDENIFPVSFVLTLYDSALATQVFDRSLLISGVYRVDYSQEAVNLIVRVNTWMQGITIFLAGLLSFIAVTIVSNTVKLTVMARQKEIAIMKYVGATEEYIKWPFIVEGMVIGTLGAVFSIFIVLYAYQQFIFYYYEQGSMFFGLFQFVQISEISMLLSVIFTVFGVGIGVFGSLLSMNKYLKL